MTRQTLVGVLIAIVLVVLSNSLYVIRETQRGVLLKFGEVVTRISSRASISRSRS